MSGTSSQPSSTSIDAVSGSLATGEPWDAAQAEQTARLLKAVADPARLRLLSIIRAAKDQEACVRDLVPAVGLSQPTVSHHLRVLTEAGLLSRERRGAWAWFHLVPGRLDDLAAIFH